MISHERSQDSLGSGRILEVVESLALAGNYLISRANSEITAAIGLPCKCNGGLMFLYF